VMETTQNGSHRHARSQPVVPCDWCSDGFSPIGQTGAERCMRPPAIVVRDPFAQDAPQMSFVEGNDRVKALTTRRVEGLICSDERSDRRQREVSNWPLEH
jgi:hypothetical protein